MLAAMDPLGAVENIADIKTLQRWTATAVPEYDILVDNPESRKLSPFKYSENLNQKLILWRGDITQLNTEAIVNPTNESMNDKNQLSDKIFAKAGSDLKKEIRSSIKVCRTGEAKISRGYRLLCRYVIHTVGPKYNIKYRTAAESALYSCYRNTLNIVRESRINSLGLCAIHSSRRNYPAHEGAHIAIRTVRRFLEKFGDSLDTIVFVVSGEDEEVYLSLLPLYFPRSQSEEDFTAYHLPYDIGNEDGEPVIAERQIRIQPKPSANMHKSIESIEDLEQSVNINDVFETSVSVGKHAFAKMESDVDRERMKRQPSLPNHQNPQIFYQQERQKRYERKLRAAREEDFSVLSSLRFLYWSGFDKYGRRVITVIAKHFPAETINYHKALLYIINTLDPIVDKPYVIVYVHTQCSRENSPGTQFFRDIYNIIDDRYLHNLQAVYMVHTSVWSKLLTWFYTTFSLGDIKSKVHHIPGLEYLYTRIPTDQLDLPKFVLQHDLKVHGIRYYRPEEDQAIGAL